MKKKHKTLYLAKETLATLTGRASVGETTLMPESTLTPCTSLCTTCTEVTGSGGACLQ